MAQKNEDKTITIQGRDLIKELGLENLPVERQEKLVEEISDVVYGRILLRIVDELSEEEAEELNNLFDKGGMEKVDEYLRDKVPDFVSVLEEEIKSFGDEMIEKAK